LIRSIFFRTDAGSLKKMRQDEALADIPQLHVGNEGDNASDGSRSRKDPKYRRNCIQLDSSDTGPHDISFARTSVGSPRNAAPC